jgi:hypothetical protein
MVQLSLAPAAPTEGSNFYSSASPGSTSSRP